MKIFIFGASGSGVTTLGNALANQLNLPYLDSDNYYWEPSEPPFTLKREPEERNQLLIQELTQYKSWILGGPVFTWKSDELPPSADLIVFLYIPKRIRMERLKTREIERYGDVLFTDPERNRLYKDFLAWAGDYDDATGLANRTLLSQKEWLAKTHLPVLELEGDLSVEERKKRILNAIKPNKK